MNSLAHACVALFGTAVVASAGPAETAIIAAMDLSEQLNYGWFTMVDDQSGSYEIEGKTSQGVTWLKMPMISSIARRLGRESESQLEALCQGGSIGIVRVGNSWTSIAELVVPREPDDARTRPMVRGSASGAFGIAGGQSLGAAAPFLEDRRGMRPGSALEFGVAYPHEELAIIVSSFSSMDAGDEGVTGTLSDLGAALLLVAPHRTDVEPLAAAGTFRIWFQNGAVSKYHVKLEGVLSVRHRKPINVKVHATTLLKDIGATQVIVPIDARALFATSR